MKPRDIIAKVRKIEIQTLHLVDELTAGAYHSIFKGKGVEFAEVREYVDGDDVRDIDWNVTAKMNSLFVKQFTEERELNVFILLDVSASSLVSYNLHSRYELSVELASLFIFSAIRNNDQVGLMLFSEKEELHIPARKGRNHGLRLLREMIVYQPKNKKTSIASALESFFKSAKKRTTLFLISDLLDEGFEKNIQMVKQKHDLIIIHIHENLSKTFPLKGFVNLEDSETGELVTFLGNKKNREKYLKQKKEKIEKNIDTCRKLGIDIISVAHGENYLPALRNFFKKRGRRR